MKSIEKKILPLLTFIFLTVFFGICCVKIFSGVIDFLGTKKLSELKKLKEEVLESPAFVKKCYNQVEYSVFKEIPGDWILGKDGYIYQKSQVVSLVGGRLTNKWQENQFDEYASKIAEFQAKMIAEGKYFVYILTPLKPEISPEYLPWNYKLAYKDFSEDSKSIRECLKKSFSDKGILFYDTTDDLKSFKKANEFPVFHSASHHWTQMSVLKTMQNVFDFISEKYPEFDKPEISVTGLEHGSYVGDEELLDVARSFRMKSDSEYFMPLYSFPKKSSENFYLFGTSFGVGITDALYALAPEYISPEYIFQEYMALRTSYDKTGMAQLPLSRDTDPAFVIPDIQKSKLIIMEQQSYLGILEPHLKFLDYTNKKFK